MTGFSKQNVSKDECVISSSHFTDSECESEDSDITRLETEISFDLL
jgi:hypothetical protein